MAIQGSLIFSTSFNIPIPTRPTQFIVDVKCGIQSIFVLI